MYAKFFGLKREPFSIAPDPRFLFMSERHREALAHLLYGVGGGGGFVLLTGEIGAGKTTVCRCFLEQIPRRCNVAYIFNPKLTVAELLKSVCDEFRIPHAHPGPGVETVKDYLDPLNEFLLKTHAVGQNNVLIIDEAQNLSAEVLEQLRLLTNLETSERKLLQIILIGQPELRTMLARPELEQLAQRVIARFHLEALSVSETGQYIQHRLTISGLKTAHPFERAALQRIHHITKGVPRRINLLCDRALLGAYGQGLARVDVAMVDKAAQEVFDQTPPPPPPERPHWVQRLIEAPPRMWWGVAGVSLGSALLLGLGHGLGTRWMADAPSAPSAAASAPANSPVGSPANSPADVQVAPAATRPAGQGEVGASSESRATALPVSAMAPARTGVELMERFPVPLLEERDAWRGLAPWWHLQVGTGDPCGAAARQGVLCFKGHGGIGMVRRLDRPGIVTLHPVPGQVVYALLTGLTAEAVTLRMGEHSQTLALTTLLSMWRGDFATYWRTPPGYRHKVLLGQQGSAVDWLAQRLARLDGHAAPTGPQRFDESLRDRVQAFQTAQGLQPDGVAGAGTFMVLNRLTGVSEPRLSAPAPAKAVAAST